MTASFVADILLVQTIQVTIVGGLVWLVTIILGDRNPRISHALWLLVLLKCVTSPLWSYSFSPWASEQLVAIQSTQETRVRLDDNKSRFQAHQSAPMQRSTETKASLETESKPRVLPVTTIAISDNISPSPLGAGWTWQSTVIAFWMLGAFSVTAVFVFRIARTLICINKQPQVINTLIEAEVQRLRRQLGIFSHVRLKILDGLIGPLVYGFLRPSIVLPDIVVRDQSIEKLSPLIAHELIHIRRGDIWFALLQTVAKVLFWFHPLVWMAAYRLNQTSELCCDEQTVRELGCAPADYARGLINILEKRHQLRVAAALPGVRPVDVTAKRLERIMSLRHGGRTTVARWQTACILIVGLALLPSISRSQAQVTAKPEHEEVAAIDPGTKIDVSSDDGRTVRAYDVKPLLQRLSEHGESNDQARSVLVADLLWLSDTAQSVKAPKLVEFKTDNGSIQLGGDEQSAKLRGDTLYVYANEDDHTRLQQTIANRVRYGYTQVYISTRRISLPTYLLDKVDVKWSLQNVGEATINSTVKDQSASSEPTKIPSVNVPYFYVMLDEVQSKQFLDQMQSDSRTSMIQSPSMVLFNGQFAKESYLTRQTIVTLEGEKGQQQPSLRNVELGAVFEVTPEILTDGKIHLEATIGQSRIQGVNHLNYKDPALGAINIETPKVVGEIYNVSVDVPDSSSILLCREIPREENGEKHFDLILINLRSIHNAADGKPATTLPYMELNNWAKFNVSPTQTWPHVMHSDRILAAATYKTSEPSRQTSQDGSVSKDDTTQVEHYLGSLFDAKRFEGDLTCELSPTRVHIYGTKFKLMSDAEGSFSISADRVDLVSTTSDREYRMSLEGNTTFSCSEFVASGDTMVVDTKGEIAMSLERNATVSIDKHSAVLKADEIHIGKNAASYTAIGNVVLTSKSEAGGISKLTANKLQWNSKTNEILRN